MMCKKTNLLILGVGLLSLALTGSATAGTILVFGQTGTTPPNLFTATRTDGTTMLSAVDISVTITALDAVNSLPHTFPHAYLWLNATNVNAATRVNGQIIQDYSGSFGITSGQGATGVNYLSGTFQDSVFGSGTGLTLSASDGFPNPGGEKVSFTSDLITGLLADHALSFAFTNVTPSASIVNGTLDSFNSNVAGTFSAVPEPSSVVLLALGLGTLAVLANRQRRVG
jgi:hypothetical protein